MSFANQLKQAMNEAEISQSELSIKTGLLKSSISQYVSGKNTPSRKSIEKIAEALGCSVELFYSAPAEIDNIKLRNVSIAEAARRLDKCQQFVRVGLQKQRLPFGTAVQVTGKKWSYHISPKLLDEYIGKEDVE